VRPNPSTDATVLIFPPSTLGLSALAGSYAAFLRMVFAFKRLAHENRA